MFAEALAGVQIGSIILTGLNKVRNRGLPEKERKEAALDVYSKTIKYFINRWDVLVKEGDPKNGSIAIGLFTDHFDLFIQVATELDGLIENEKIEKLKSYASQMIQNSPRINTFTALTNVVPNSKTLIEDMKKEVS